MTRIPRVLLWVQVAQKFFPVGVFLFNRCFGAGNTPALLADRLVDFNEGYCAEPAGLDEVPGAIVFAIRTALGAELNNAIRSFDRLPRCFDLIKVATKRFLDVDVFPGLDCLVQVIGMLKIGGGNDQTVDVFERADFSQSSGRSQFPIVVLLKLCGGSLPALLPDIANRGK